MTLLENFRTAFRALWTNGLRSFLALLGIIIGVFAVTAMVSLGKMLIAGVNKSLESVASRSVIVQPDYSLGLNLRRLKPEDLQALSILPVTVNPQLQASAQYDRPNSKRNGMSMIGTEGDIQAIDPSIRLSKGRYFTEQEARAGLPVAVLNPDAVRELVGNRNPIGETVRVYFPDSRAEFTVVGVIEPLPAMFGGGVPTAYVPTPTLWRLHPDTRRNEYDYTILRVRDGYDEKEVEAQAKRIMESRYGAGIFMVQSIAAFQTMLGGISTGLSISLGFIAALSLLVGGIGIMNIMLVSVTERTREIGLRKALGATSHQIMVQFLIESSLLTLIGGVIGLMSAVLLLWVVSKLVAFLSVFILEPFTVILALGVSVLIGLLFGVVPAIRAARLDPIESLRYE